MLNCPIGAKAASQNSLWKIDLSTVRWHWDRKDAWNLSKVSIWGRNGSAVSLVQGCIRMASRPGLIWVYVSLSPACSKSVVSVIVHWLQIQAHILQISFCIKIFLNYFMETLVPDGSIQMILMQKLIINADEEPPIENTGFVKQQDYFGLIWQILIECLSLCRLCPRDQEYIREQNKVSHMMGYDSDSEKDIFK